MTELVERLLVGDDGCILLPKLRKEAATALEAQAKELEALRASVDKWHRAAMNAGVIVHVDGSLSYSMTARAETAERRVAELEGELTDTQQALTGVNGDWNKALARAETAERERDEAGWHTFADRPKSGRKFIALHNDGSGAEMFFAFDGGVIDSDGDEHYDWNPDDTSYDRWAYLPDSLEFWCEIRAEDPVSLRAARAITGED